MQRLRLVGSQHRQGRLRGDCRFHRGRRENRSFRLASRRPEAPGPKRGDHRTPHCVSPGRVPGVPVLPTATAGPAHFAHRRRGLPCADHLTAPHGRQLPPAVQGVHGKRGDLVGPAVAERSSGRPLSSAQPARTPWGIGWRLTGDVPGARTVAGRDAGAGRRWRAGLAARRPAGDLACVRRFEDIVRDDALERRDCRGLRSSCVIRFPGGARTAPRACAAM